MSKACVGVQDTERESLVLSSRESSREIIHKTNDTCKGQAIPPYHIVARRPSVLNDLHAAQFEHEHVAGDRRRRQLGQGDHRHRHHRRVPAARDGVLAPRTAREADEGDDWGWGGMNCAAGKVKLLRPPICCAQSSPCHEGKRRPTSWSGLEAIKAIVWADSLMT